MPKSRSNTVSIAFCFVTRLRVASFLKDGVTCLVSETRQYFELLLLFFPQGGNSRCLGWCFFFFTQVTIHQTLEAVSCDSLSARQSWRSGYRPCTVVVTELVRGWTASKANLVCNRGFLITSSVPW